MFGFLSKKARAGRRLVASAVNRPGEAAERLSRARPGGALAQVEAAGTPYLYDARGPKWLVRITTVGTSTQAGSYGWQAIYPVAGSPNTYADLDGWSGDLGGDALWEENGNSGLSVDDRVYVRRERYSGEVRGQYDHC